MTDQFNTASVVSNSNSEINYPNNRVSEFTMVNNQTWNIVSYI